MNPFSWNHAVLTLLVVGACALLRKPGHRASLLTLVAVFGMVFAGYAHPLLRVIYVGISVGVLLVGWGFGRLMARRAETSDPKALLATALVFLFSPLFLLKLVMALLPSAALLSVQQQAPGFNLASLLPVGISYFSFRSAAYLIEIKRKTLQPVSLGRFVHYALFWPTLLAGPIERPGAFFKQSQSIKRPDRDDIVEGLARIVGGFVKKTVLGSFFLAMARPYLEMGGDFQARMDSFTTPHLWLCITAYYLYLYCDFSGYSDLAIGASRMLGFRIMENFRWPVLATNVADFWRRWHISLTSWVTDYIYIGLGGNRRGLTKAAVYTATAMIVVGAWHGMNFHFLVWGAYHAALLILFRQWRKSWRARLFPSGVPGPAWLAKGAAWFATFQLVNLGWVLFLHPVGKAVTIWLKLLGID